MQCITSITGCHTETINIWSHLLGAAWFSSRAVRFAGLCIHPLTLNDAVVLGYFLAFALCFWCSTIYHVFANHAQASFWQHIDHFGIVIIIWASALSFVFFSFENQQGVQQTYIVLVTLAALLCLVCLSELQLHHHKKRRGRIVALDRQADLLRPFWILVITNSAGGGIYAMNLLENAVGTRLGIPDISHNVMHVIIVVGACVYEHGLLYIHRLKSA